MQAFDEINPFSISQNPKVIASIVDPNNQDRTFYVLIDVNYSIIASAKMHTYPETGKSEWLTHQLELPKAGIKWIVNTLENKFLKLSHDGGLPADVRHFEEIVDGEKLGISRAMGLGTDDNREAGYTIYTHSRKSEWDTSKKMSFTESFLFEYGFFDILKKISEKIEKDQI
ncbi:MAG: hypothetical protein CMK89_07575 [Pseudomonadales bacterium]|nr:hypothetical protein [Pseudomonadales bacterium]